MSSEKVLLFDPSLYGLDRGLSPNLGNLIIHEAVARELNGLLGVNSYARLSPLAPLSASEYAAANRARVRFVGGTNLLSSSMVKYTWYREEHRLNWLFPKLKPVTLLGVGWGVGYPTWNDWRLKVFYRRNLHRRHLHSVRDSFSEGMLREIGIRNVINTSCPSMWQLDAFVPNPPGPAADVLFTLTDYRRVPARDNRLLEQLARLFPGMLYFFPQGAGDRAYLETLEGYTACAERVQILAPSVPALDRFLLDHGNSLLYVGTRLHGGIFSMQHGVSALIIQVDNRAAEIAKDTGLPVIGAEFDRDMERWLTGQLRFEPLRMPVGNIERWRAYWRDQLG